MWHGGGPSGGEALRGFQLWVTLPPALELAPAFSDYVHGDAVPSDGPARLLLGSYRGMTSNIAYHEPGSYSVHTSRDALVRGEAGYAAIAKTMSLVPGRPITVTR